MRQYKPRKESKTEEHYGGSKTTTVTWHADPVWRPVLHDDAGYYFNSNPLLLQPANMSSRSSANSTTHSTAHSATRILLQECGLTYLPRIYLPLPQVPGGVQQRHGAQPVQRLARLLAAAGPAR